MQEDNKKLYVGSLPYSTTEDELRELFSQYGATSSVRIVSDKFTGQSKGFGFVEMESTDDAQRAIEALNGAQIGGRTLIVNHARPPQERENRGSGERRRFGGEERRYRSRMGE